MMKKVLLLVALVGVGNAQEQPVPTVPNPIPNNTLPGIVVMWPVPDNSQEHMRLAASFMVTGNLPGGTRLVASAVLPTGQQIMLRNFFPDACFVRYSYSQPGPYPRSLAD